MKTNLKVVIGNWTVGYTLDKHLVSSTFLGDDANGRPRFDNTRSEVGEAVYQLKYQGDLTQVAKLADEIYKTVCPLLTNIQLIIPMPASKPRPNQPVTEIAKHLAGLLKVKVFENILTKATTGKSMKDFSSKEAKAAELAGKFQLYDEIKPNGQWNALIVDDLFDSGATMEAACAVLRTYPKIKNIYVVALTRTH